MTLEIDGPQGLRDRVGQHLGHSGWVEIDQPTIDRFAEATGDHQWIHTDPARAAQESPYGTTIAHGYLTLALVPRLAPEIYRVGNVSMSLNYGCDRVRFPSPVPAGARVRMAAELLGVEPVGGDTVQVAMRFSFELQDDSSPSGVAPKPACIVDALFRYVS